MAGADSRGSTAPTTPGWSGRWWRSSATSTRPRRRPGGVRQGVAALVAGARLPRAPGLGAAGGPQLRPERAAEGPLPAAGGQAGHPERPAPVCPPRRRPGRSDQPGRDHQYPAVTVPPGPPATAVPPTTAPPATTSPPTTAPAVAAASFPAAPPMVGDAEATVLAAQLVTRDSGWALSRDRLAWTRDGGRSWRTITPARSRPAGSGAPSSSTRGPAGR